MTKPWEEEWEPFEANKGYPGFAARIGPSELRVFESMSGEDDDIPRARLAAAAPEMARILMALVNPDSCTTTSYIDGDDQRLIRAALTKAGVLRHGAEP